jgi:hypothetical protein
MITFQVMAFTDVSAHHQHTVGAPMEGLQHEVRMDHAGAHDPHGAHVWRVLQPGHSRQIAAGIGAPVAEEPQDNWLKFFTHFRVSLLFVQMFGLSAKLFQFPMSCPSTREKNNFSFCLAEKLFGWFGPKFRAQGGRTPRCEAYGRYAAASAAQSPSQQVDVRQGHQATSRAAATCALN